MKLEIKISPANKENFDEIWRIFKSVISTGETYVNGDETTKEEACAKWMGKSAKIFVAKIGHEIVGVYLIKPNLSRSGLAYRKC